MTNHSMTTDPYLTTYVRRSQSDHGSRADRQIASLLSAWTTATLSAWTATPGIMLIMLQFHASPVSQT